MALAEDEQDGAGEDEVEARHDRRHDDDEHDHHGGVGHQLLARGPDDLAQFGDDLTNEEGEAAEDIAARALLRTLLGALAVRVVLVGTVVDECVRVGHAFLLPCIHARSHSTTGAFVLPQGRRDLNPQPPVLETGTLAS